MWHVADAWLPELLIPLMLDELDAHGTAIVGIEAHPPKVRPFVITPEIHEAYHWFRVPDTTPEQRLRVVQAALRRDGEPYGYRKAVKAAAVWAMRKLGLVKIAASIQAVHCDELVIRAFLDAIARNITPHIRADLALPDDIANGIAERV